MSRDRITRERRSWNMSRIRGADTRPELQVRSFLHRVGLRFRLHGRDLPGRPDIVFPAARAAVFVHGCFWHRHPGCALSTTPTGNAEFWARKFGDNVRRDRRNQLALRRSGWTPMIVWECQVEKPGTLEALALELLARVAMSKEAGEKK